MFLWRAEPMPWLLKTLGHEQEDTLKEPLLL